MHLSISSPRFNFSYTSRDYPMATAPVIANRASANNAQAVCRPLQRASDKRVISLGQSLRNMKTEESDEHRKEEENN
jgi:hypothetical protein